MKNYATLIALSVIAIASVAAITTVGFPASTLSVAAMEKQATGLQLQGHLELIATDSDGIIKSYVQTDNAIVDNGTECIINALFIQSVWNGDCDGNSGVFDFIALGANATAAGAPDDVDTATDWNAPVSTGLDTALQAVPSGGSVSGDASGATFANATVTVDFTNDGTGQELINEAALLNSTVGGTTATLAYQSFTAIPLDPSDSLSVAWTVTVTEG